eukprot:9476100-Pyramimonas_sp.AAC.2
MPNEPLLITTHPPPFIRCRCIKVEPTQGPPERLAEAVDVWLTRAAAALGDETTSVPPWAPREHVREDEGEKTRAGVLPSGRSESVRAAIASLEGAGFHLHPPALPAAAALVRFSYGH